MDYDSLFKNYRKSKSKINSKTNSKSKTKSNSINIIKDIYSKHSQKFLNYAIDILNTIKVDNAVINIPEINEFIYNNVLHDIHLSKYTSNRIFNLVELDVIPESYTSYGEDSKDIDDTNIGESEDFESEKYIQEQYKADIRYNEELASDLWSKIMIYGGLQQYQDMINKIIEDVEKINKDSVDKMK